MFDEDTEKVVENQGPEDKINIIDILFSLHNMFSCM